MPRSPRPRTNISAASDVPAIRCPDPPTRDPKDPRGVSRCFPKQEAAGTNMGQPDRILSALDCRQDDATAVDSVRVRNRAIARLASAKARKTPVSTSESVHVRACVLRSCATLEVSVAIV